MSICISSYEQKREIRENEREKERKENEAGDHI